MAYVAEQLGVAVETCRSSPRDLAAPRPACSVRLAAIIRRVRPHILHTHTAKAGAVGRVAALLAGDATAADRRPHLPWPRPPRLLRPVARACSGSLERSLARATTALVAVSPEVRDDLVSLGVAPPEKFAVIRLGIALDERVERADGRGGRAGCSASRPTDSSSAGSGV